jgi:hypothetical protein
MSAATAICVCIKLRTKNRLHNQIRVTRITVCGLVHKTRVRYASELDFKSDKKAIKTAETSRS